MKNLVLFILYLGFVLSISGCGVKINYEDRKDFTNEQEKERKELYKDVLHSVGVDSVDKFALIYIDYIMTESDRFKTLEKLNPTDNFSDFFLEAVPVLYYSYSPTTYKSVPKELKERTTRYILEQTPYPLENGEKKYRKWFEKQLKNEEWYAFPFYNKDDPEKDARGSNDTEKFSQLYTLIAWVDDFNFEDFKILNKSSQGFLISMKARMNYVTNGNTINDNAIELFEKIKKIWEKRADDFMKDPKFTALRDDTSFNDVSDIAIKLILKSD